MELSALTAVGCTAGAINAVAGGGTLLTFPVLLLCDTPPVLANATSTVGLVIGTAGSMVGFRGHMRAIRPLVLRFVPVCLVGAAFGSWLLTKTNDDQFSKLVPFLVLFATVLFFLQGFLRRASREHHADDPSKAVWFSLALQLPVAVYGAFFGAGIGILMLASFGFMGMTHIHEMNTLKNVLGSFINVIAAVWFIVAGHGELAAGPGADGRGVARILSWCALLPAHLAQTGAASHHGHRADHLCGDVLAAVLTCSRRSCHTPGGGAAPLAALVACLLCSNSRRRSRLATGAAALAG